MRIAGNSVTPAYREEVEPINIGQVRKEIREQRFGRDDVPNLLHRLRMLPFVPFSRGDDGKKVLFCDRSTPLYRRLVEEYSDLHRLAEMSSLAKKSALMAITAHASETVIELSELLTRDKEARLWFITNENTQVNQSFRYWYENKSRIMAANILSPFIAYKGAIKKIAGYCDAYGPITRMAKEYQR